MSEDGLSALLGLIDNQRSARRTGGVVVGHREGLIHFLFGQPMHAEASPPGSAAVVGLEAVRTIGRLAASGRPASWDPKAPMTADRSLETVSIGDVLHALREGAQDGPVPNAPMEQAPLMSETAPEPPPTQKPPEPTTPGRLPGTRSGTEALVAPPVRPAQPELNLTIGDPADPADITGTLASD